jgi:tRNA threonylcarbamoyladenosine biosynthesis protein TsaE
VVIILKIQFNNEQQTQAFAQKLARHITQPTIIYLHGDLGTGKTTFARAFIQFFGFTRIKSPTYNLVESYENQKINIHHFDLYRLSDPDELNYLGIRDYLGVQLIEWPEHGLGAIQPADISLYLEGYENTRQLTIQTKTLLGADIKKCINL